MGETFDEYVSLGDRCETAFQIRRVLGMDGMFASFFNWNVTHIDALHTLLTTRFKDILRFDHLTPTEWLVHDAAGDYLFHLTGEGRRSKEHPDFLSDLENHRNKVAHMLENYFALANSGRRICYFYRTEDTGDQLSHAALIRDDLSSIHGNQEFALVFLQQEEARSPRWNEPMIFNRYVRRLSPKEDQGDSHILSWDAVFREFPRHGHMNLCYWL